MINPKQAAAFAAAGLNLPILSEKKKWEVQAEGCYDLLYKYINVDYPTRIEIQQWVSALFVSHNMNAHNIGLPIVTPVPEAPILMPAIAKEKIMVKAGSDVNGVGYGV